MTIYAICAPMGEGKTYRAMRYTRELLQRGVFIATNVHAACLGVFPPVASNTFLRLPIWPSARNLSDLAVYASDNTSKSGVVVLDDFDVMLQSSRGDGVRDWVLSSEKDRWDVLVTFRRRHLIDEEMRLQFGRLDELLPPVDSFVKPISAEQLLGGVNV